MKIKDFDKSTDLCAVFKDDGGTYYPVWDYKDKDGTAYLIVSPEPVGKIKPEDLDVITVAELRQEFDEDLNLAWEDDLVEVKVITPDLQKNVVFLK